MTKITKREKTLLLVLLFTAIIVCGFMFAIKPVMQIKANNQITISQLSDKKTQLEMDIARKPIVESKLAEVTKELSSASYDYYGPLTSWEAERIVTNTLKACGVNIKSIVMLPPVPFNPVSSDENGTDVKTAEGEEIPIVASDIDIIRLTVDFSASTDSIIKYLDTISTSSKKIAITDWSYTNKEDASLEGNITIEIYCLNPMTN